MKVTSQEEHGIKMLIRIAGCKSKTGISIPQLSEAEGLSIHYVAKLTRLLRMAGFINSTPGIKGGYILARPAEQIVINDVLKALGGSLFEGPFKESMEGGLELCNGSVDCTARSLWQMIQFTMDNLLNQITLHHLVNHEEESARVLEKILMSGFEQRLALKQTVVRTN